MSAADATQAVISSTPPSEPTTARWLSIEKAAVYARMSVGTIYRRIRQSTLPAYSVGKKTLLRIEDVDELKHPTPRRLVISTKKKKAP